jgi:hypothetical protein
MGGGLSQDIEPEKGQIAIRLVVIDSVFGKVEGAWWRRKSVSRFSRRSTSGSLRLSASSPMCSTPIGVICVSRDTDMVFLLN